MKKKTTPSLGPSSKREHSKKSLKPHPSETTNVMITSSSQNMFSNNLRSAINTHSSFRSTKQSRASGNGQVTCSFPTNSYGNEANNSELKASARSRSKHIDDASYLRHHPIIELKNGTIDLGKNNSKKQGSLAATSKILNTNSSSTIGLALHPSMGILEQTVRQNNFSPDLQQ